VRIGCAITILALLVPNAARAHPLGFGALTIAERPDGSLDASLRFSSLEAAPSSIEPIFPARCRPLAPARQLELREAIVRRYRLDCGDDLAGAAIEIRGLEGSGAEIAVRLERADGTVTRALLSDTSPRLIVPADAGEGVFARYLALGLEHIALGIDHLLFVLALVLIVRRARPLALTITAFTLGHSATLALAALGLVSIPRAPIEACIAASIALLALELARPERDGMLRDRPWLLAALFGLLHGFGFASALSDAGLPRGDLAEALLAFNLGVELGQLAFVGACLSAIFAARKIGAGPRTRAAVVYALGGCAFYFFLDRAAALGAAA
jgi:hydrogenase/urease accessory protein HupE